MILIHGKKSENLLKQITHQLHQIPTFAQKSIQMKIEFPDVKTKFLSLAVIEITRTRVLA